MDPRAAYTATLLQLPPVTTGLVGMLAGFGCTAVPALDLGRWGAGEVTIGPGLGWGASLTGLICFALGAFGWWILRLGRAGPGTRRGLAVAMAISGVTGWAGLLAGAAVAGRIVGRVSWESIAQEIAAGWLDGAVVAIACGIGAAAVMWLRPPVSQARD